MTIGIRSRAACGRLGFLTAALAASLGTCRAQLEVINGLAHKFKANERISGRIEVWNRGTQQETALLTVRPLVPRQAPPVDSAMVTAIRIKHSVSILPGEKVVIPFEADSLDRTMTTACMIYVEPAWALAYQWDVPGDSIGMLAVVRYGVAVLAAGGGVPDSAVTVHPVRDSSGLWLEFHNRSKSLWIPKAIWSERGKGNQKNEWVLLPGEYRRIRWNQASQGSGRLIVMDDDRRRWQWNL